jgi:alkylhydroperoxidase family enzyme
VRAEDARVTWLPEQATGDSDFARTVGLRENLFAAWRELASLLWEKRLAPPVILQLAQLRVRQLHGLALASQRMSEALDAGWDESRVGELSAWWKSPRFSAAERACLRLAEQFVLDAKGIGDADVAPVRAALGDAGVVALVEALALFDGFTRFQKMLGIAEAGGASPPSRRREPRVVTAGSLRISLPAPLGDDPIQASALAHQPEALAAFMKLYGTLWSRGLLSHSTKEMARIRSARTVDCGF